MTTGNAQIDWIAGLPHSRQYGDVYFSSDSGLDETKHVFLTGNNLQQRWQSLANRHFTIVETGFGTGLNFLCAWQLWNESAPPTAQLHYVSIEKFPLTATDMAKALSLWPQLTKQREQLLAQYKWLTPGFHRLVFEHGRINLTLLVGDVAEILPQLRNRHLETPVHAWFLDGFSPAKNPAMWQQSLFDDMASLSCDATTFATFTSAGDVRRGLQSAGFNVHKAPGYGRKREMLWGECGASLPAIKNSHGQHTIVQTAKYNPDTMDAKTPNTGNKAARLNPKVPNAIVIGGGIAGTASSHALAARGWQVHLIERHNKLAQEASGNPLGMLYPRLAAKETTQSQLALSSFLYTSRLLQQLDPGNTNHKACGILQLAFDARESDRFKTVTAACGQSSDLMQYVSKTKASEIAGVTVIYDALYFPSAGWVKPVEFCAMLASHDNIKTLTSSYALKLVRNGELWQVWNEKKILAEAPVVIIANANDASGFEQSAHLQFQPVRGQISCVSPTAASQQLKSILCTDGYISPAVDGQQCIGSTFAPDEITVETREEDHLLNLVMLQRMVPELHQDLSRQPWSGRAALRCATSDYLPVTGPLLDSAALIAKPPRHNANPAELPWLPGLYVNAGHGSKGLITAPLCAEILASAICGEPLPVDAGLLAALDPNRFLLKKIGLKRLLAAAHH